MDYIIPVSAGDPRFEGSSLVGGPAQPRTVATSCAASSGSRSAATGYASPVVTHASASFGVGSSQVAAFNRTIVTHASASSGSGSGSVDLPLVVVATTATSTASFGSGSTSSASRVVATTGSASSGSGSATSSLAARNVSTHASASAGFSSATSPAAARNVVTHCSAASGSGSASRSNLSFTTHASASFGVGSATAVSLVVTTHASASAGFGASQTRSRVVTTSATASSGSGSVSASRSTGTTCSASAGFGSASHGFVSAFTCSASAGFGSTQKIEVVSGDSGLNRVLASGVSPTHPFSFAETPTGRVLLANGVGPALVWEPTSGAASTAGVSPPAGALSLGGSGVGAITGERVAYQRFLDADGHPSNLSPASNLVLMGFDRLIDDVTVDPATGLVTVRSLGHGLATGEAVVVRDVQGMTGLNGVRTVRVLDPDTFSVAGFSATANTWTQGGSWAWGVATVVYSAVPKPTDPKAVRRQILRNLEGTLDVLYVDVDTADLNATDFASTLDDEALAASEPVPLRDGEGLPYADRNAPPPSWKLALCAHHGRVFAAADAEYSEGCVLAAPGSDAVQGVGTHWRSCFAGRFIEVSGSRARLEILSVDEDAQTAVLASKVHAADAPFALYSIAPAPAERNLVYYSEAGRPEAWPPWNVVALPDDGDAVVGLFASGSSLYAVKRRHVYRMVFSGVPATGGSLHLACRRGAVNHRCVVQVEDRVFMLDGSGVHSFDGESSDRPISTPIQTVFHGDGLDTADVQVDWSADPALWHGSHDPARETVRWFVNVVGSDKLDHALCYHHRLDRWWVERYPAAMTSAAAADLGYRRCVAGSEARSVVALWEGTLDAAPEGQGTLRGTATSGDETSITDSTAAFPGGLSGAPVSIVAGTGKGQQSVVASNTATTITVVRRWATPPDATSEYQVGGVDWAWKSGWFRLSDDQTGNPRDVSAVYRPLDDPATMDVRLYYDHAAEPRAWGYTQSNDGVSTTAGSPDVTVDLSRSSPRPGFSVQRFEGHQDEHAFGDLHVALGLSGTQGSGQVRVSHLVLSGASHGGEPDA